MRPPITPGPAVTRPAAESAVTLLPPPLAFEEVVEPVAEQLESEDGREDRERRRGRGPELALQEIIGPSLDHIAPRRRGLLHAEAEVAQTRLDQDRLGHAEGGLDHEQ